MRILKSRGNWIDGHLMLNRQELEGLGLNRADINPMHIDPRTKRRFDPSFYTVKHGYDALVDVLAHNIMRAGHTKDVGKAKMMARHHLNEATKRFNHRKATIGDKVHLLPLPYREDGAPGLNPEYKMTHFSEKHQKHARMERDGTISTDTRGGASRVHPAARQVRVLDPTTGKWVLATRSLSSKDDPDVGEIIEGDELHPYADLQAVVRENGYHFPYNETRGGIINADIMVEDAAGLGRGWRRHHKVQDPTSVLHGGGTRKDDKMHRGIDGKGYNMLRAIASLHPIFFRVTGSPENVVAERASILGDIFGDSVQPETLLNIARTPVGELLTEEFRGFADRPSSDYKPGRSARSGLRRALNEVKKLAGVPTKDEVAAAGGLGSSHQERRDEFDYNADNILLVMGAGHGSRNDFQQSRKKLAEALYASLLARRQSLTRPDPLQTTFFSHFPQVKPIDPSEIKDIPYHSSMGPKFRTMPSESPVRQPFAPGGGVSPGAQVGVMGGASAGSELTPVQSSQLDPRSTIRLSMDPVFTIMEMLQRADAQLDDEILKSLPGKRKFSIKDSGDREELCKTYDIVEADLYYIKEGRGDWDRIAEDLKVGSHIVRGVKLALGE